MLPQLRTRRSKSDDALKFSLEVNRICFSGRLLLIGPEVPHIRRFLSLLCRHQGAIGADHVVITADVDVAVAFSTNVLSPEGPRIRIAVIGLRHLPGTRQSVVGYRNLVNEHVLLRLAQIDALMNDTLVVRM